MPTEQHYEDWPYHVEEELSGIEPHTELTPEEEKLEAGLDYVSKSRITTYRENPYKFYLKYWCEHRPPGTFYMERGSRVHEIFEQFHENVIERGELPERFTDTMPHGLNTMQWGDFIGSFWEFELRRLDEAERTIGFVEKRLPAETPTPDPFELWVPQEVESEFWMGEPPSDYDGDPDYIDSNGAPVGDIPWMGKADAVVRTSSVPGLTGSGVTILDYKTGSCPTIKYEGAPFLDEIKEDYFIETEFYGWMAEHVYDVDAVALYFPKDDELMVGEYGVQSRRYEIMDAANSLQQRPEQPDNDGVPANFPMVESNLTHYGHGMDYFYNIMPTNAGES